MKKYMDRNTISINEKELLCDDYIVICKNKASDKLEILGNVNIRDMARMIMPLVDMVLASESEL